MADCPCSGPTVEAVRGAQGCLPLLKAKMYPASYNIFLVCICILYMLIVFLWKCMCSKGICNAISLLPILGKKKPKNCLVRYNRRYLNRHTWQIRYPTILQDITKIFTWQIKFSNTLPLPCHFSLMCYLTCPTLVWIVTSIVWTFDKQKEIDFGGALVGLNSMARMPVHLTIKRTMGMDP